jgi:hypothetical protein
MAHQCGTPKPTQNGAFVKSPFAYKEHSRLHDLTFDPDEAQSEF